MKRNEDFAAMVDDAIAKAEAEMDPEYLAKYGAAQRRAALLIVGGADGDLTPEADENQSG